MKKLISILILSLITLACTFGLVACECKHEFTNYLSDNNATYTEDGTKTAVCDRENCEETDTIVDTGSKLESKVTYNFEIVDGVANITVSNAVEEYDFNTVITSVGLKDYIVGLDKNGTQTSLTKKVDLSVGDNSFYIFETLNSQIIKTIKVIVHRNYNYNVTFEGINAPQTIEEGSLATTPEVEPTKAGYTFSGWDFDFDTKITANTNIVAIWTANNNTEYKIEYYYENIENNGYTKVESETEEKQGTTDTTVTVTAKTVEYFTFDSNLSTLSGNLNGNGSLVLKVYYKRNVYTVTFDATGGTLQSGLLTQSVKYGASATAPTLIKPGYTLDGYDKEFNNVSANLTVTAKWKINQYTLTIVYNNGTAEKKITGDYNSEITGIEEPKRGGYTFDGWDKQIPSKMPAQNITITAKWSAIFTLNGNTITGLTSHGKTLTEIEIPESIDGVEIAAIGDEAFRFCDSLTSVTIGDSVTSIGYRAFEDCGSLTSVTIGDSVTSIGYEAFRFCDSLPNITIPDSVTSIGHWAFSNCKSLQYNVEGNLKYLGNEQNKYLYLSHTTSTYITTVTINTNCKIIGYRAFEFCDSLTSVTIPDSVTSIGSLAFYYCDSLTSVTIPDSVTSIDSLAFSNCYSLTSVTIGDSVTSIGDSVFEYCRSLTSITIPNSVTSIGYGAFSYCYSLTSITIPDSVTSIGGRAFYSCSKLTSIIIPNSVTSIGSSAFYGCSKLTIYCKATSKPSGWDSYWNPSNRPVVWGYKG